MKTKATIPKSQKIITTEDLKQWGYSHYKIKKLEEVGKLERLNRTHYENMDYEGEESDFYYAQAYVPTGVICLMSAAVFYNLSTSRSAEIDVAVSRNKRVSTLPKWPDIKLYYFGKERFETGVREVMDGENHFSIYDIEKTVVDIVYYRNKIGIEETKEVLKKYLQREDRNINQLYRYGELLKTNGILQSYLEVLI